MKDFIFFAIQRLLPTVIFEIHVHVMNLIGKAEADPTHGIRIINVFCFNSLAKEYALR